MKTTKQGKCLIEGSDGVIVGIALGADFVAEHEWGVKGILRDFGVPKSKYEDILSGPLGVERHQVTKFPKIGLNTFRFQDDKDCTYLGLCSYYVWDDREKDLNMVSPQDFVAQWDEDSFLIKAIKETHRQFLRDLHFAFMNQDVLITSAGCLSFACNKASGLSFVIVSRLTEADRSIFYSSDKDHSNLIEASKKTGIEKKLKKSVKEYFALSPMWTRNYKGGKSLNTKHPVIYWLNPCNQQMNNFGHYTVEELEQWTNGEGPIPKK